jgi:hypothetical protein
VPRPIAAQVEKPMPTPDPVKGSDRIDAAAMAERGRPARHAHSDGPVAERILAAGPAARGRVLFADAADGRTWASGDTYKAAFGRDGFTYVPFLGSAAPRNYPVQFALDRVMVAGRPVAFDRAVELAMPREPLADLRGHVDTIAPERRSDARRQGCGGRVREAAVRTELIAQGDGRVRITRPGQVVDPRQRLAAPDRRRHLRIGPVREGSHVGDQAEQARIGDAPTEPVAIEPAPAAADENLVEGV